VITKVGRLARSLLDLITVANGEIEELAGITRGPGLPLRKGQGSVNIRVTSNDVDSTLVRDAREAYLTGTDLDTGHRVTFSGFLVSLLTAVERDGDAVATVLDSSVVQIWTPPGRDGGEEG